MKVVVDGVERRGRAVELADVDVAPVALSRAIRGAPAPGVTVDCSSPGPVHSHVGHVHDGMTVSLRAALAAAARSREVRSSQADAVATVRSRLSKLTVADVDAGTARRRAAATGDRERRLRERVATLRGRVAALRENHPDAVDDAEAELDTAMADLAEVETERIAATQRLRQVERVARTARDERERRLHLEDRLDNLERAARRELAAAVADEFAAAVPSIPGPATPDRVPLGDDPVPASFPGDPVTAALGVVAVAHVDAPVVLAAGRFDTAAAAADCLDAPVIRV